MKNYGHWRDKKDERPYFPWPEPSDTPVSIEFLNKLETIEEAITSNSLPNAQEVHWLGYSRCRCCGKSNGCLSFVLQTEKGSIGWPEGYKHYMKEHNVHPDPEFMGLIEKAFNQMLSQESSRNSLDVAKFYARFGRDPRGF